MWFEMQHITEDLIQGILINEPYFIEDMSEGNSYHLDFDNLTDCYLCRRCCYKAK